MTREAIPDDVRRFVLTSVPSVPYIELLLLLRREASKDWTASQLAKRIYVPEAQASRLLQALADSEIAEKVPNSEPAYRYSPAPELAGLLERLAAHYTANLLAITDLIHSSVNRRANKFADAFRWRKDS